MLTIRNLKKSHGGRLLFEEADIPWDDLAFRTVRETLRAFYADRAAGEFGFHQQVIN
jgi:hypothetical protein